MDIASFGSGNSRKSACPTSAFTFKPSSTLGDPGLDIIRRSTAVYFFLGVLMHSFKELAVELFPLGDPIDGEFRIRAGGADEI